MPAASGGLAQIVNEGGTRTQVRHGSLAGKTAARNPNIYYSIRNTKLCNRKRAILKFLRGRVSSCPLPSSRVTSLQWDGLLLPRLFADHYKNVSVLIWAILQFDFYVTFTRRVFYGLQISYIHSILNYNYFHYHYVCMKIANKLIFMVW